MATAGGDLPPLVQRMIFEVDPGAMRDTKLSVDQLNRVVMAGLRELERNQKRHLNKMAADEKAARDKASARQKAAAAEALSVQKEAAAEALQQQKASDRRSAQQRDHALKQDRNAERQASWESNEKKKQADKIELAQLNAHNNRMGREQTAALRKSVNADRAQLAARNALVINDQKAALRKSVNAHKAMWSMVRTVTETGARATSSLAQSALRSMGSAVGAGLHRITGMYRKGGEQQQAVMRNNLADQEALTRRALVRQQGMIQGFQSRQARGGATGVAGIGGAVGAIMSIRNMLLGAGVFISARALFGPLMEYEQTRVAFENLLGSGRAAEAMLKDLRAFNVATPFELPQIQAAAKQLLAMGESAREIIPDLTAIGDVGAKFSASDEDVNGVIRALGQMSQSAKVSAQDINQIQQRFVGFNARAAIARGLGVSVAEAMEMIASGALSGNEGMNAMIEGMKSEANAAGAMKEQMKTLSGRLSNFKDLLMQLWLDTMVPLLPVMSAVVAGLTSFIDQLAHGSGIFAVARSALLGIGIALGVLLAAQGVQLMFQGIAFALAAIANHPVVATFSFLVAAITTLVREVPAVHDFFFESLDWAKKMGRGILVDTVSLFKDLAAIVSAGFQGEAVKGLADWGQALYAVGYAASVFVGSLQLIASAFTDLIHGDFSRFRAKMEKAFTNIGKALAPAVTFVRDFIQSAVDKAVAWIQGPMPGQIAGALGAAFATVRATAGDFFSGLFGGEGGGGGAAGGMGAALHSFVTTTVWPAVQNLGGMIGDLFGRVDWGEVGKAILNGIRAAGEFITGPLLSTLLSKPVLRGLAYAIAAIAAAIGAFALGLIQGLADTIPKMWRDIRDLIVGGVGDHLGQGFANTLNRAFDFMASGLDVVGAIVDALTGRGDWGDVADQLKEALADAFQLALSAGPLLVDISQGFNQLMTNVFANIATGLTSWARGLDGIFGGVVQMIVAPFAGAFGIVSDALDRIRDFVMGWVDVIVGLFSGDFGRVFDGMRDVWGSLVGLVLDVLGRIRTALWSVFTGLGRFIWGAAEAGFRWAASQILDWVERVVGFFADLPSKIVGFFMDLPDMIGDALSAVGRAISGIFDGILNALASVWNDTIGGFTFDVPDWVPGFGGNSWSVPEIPERTVEGYGELNGQIERQVTASGEATTASENHSIALQDLRDRTDEVANSTSFFTDTLDRLTNQALPLTRVRQNIEDAMASFREVLNDPEASPAAQERAFTDYAEAIRRTSEDLMNLPGHMTEAMDSYRLQRQAIIDARVAFGDTREAARLYAEQVLGLPPVSSMRAEFKTREATDRIAVLEAKLTELGAMTPSPTVGLRTAHAEAKLEDLRHRLDIMTMAPWTVGVHVQIQADFEAWVSTRANQDEIRSALVNLAGLSGGTVPRMAKGGLVTKPTLAMVGEAGPELVIPLNDSKRAIELLGDSQLPPGFGIQPDTQGITAAINETAVAIAPLGDKIRQSTEPGMRGWVQAIRETLRTIKLTFKIWGFSMAVIATEIATAIVTSLTTTLRAGSREVGRITRGYSHKLVDALNPLLSGIGEPIVTLNFAKGGINDPRIANPADGAQLHVFNEGRRGVGSSHGEAYIPFDPTVRSRSRSIAEQTAARLGGQVQWFANGGLTASQVQPGQPTPGVSGDVIGLVTEFARRLGTWAMSMGRTFQVNSGYRSFEEQARLYRDYLAGVPGQAQAAPPGRSNHNFGVAADGPHWRDLNPGGYGLRYPMSYEPWHVEPVEGRGLADGIGAFANIVPIPEPPDAGKRGILSTVAAKWMDYVHDKVLTYAQAIQMPATTGALIPSTAADIVEELRRQATPRGWQDGAQWSGLTNIVSAESSWNPTAQNPTSTAYGLFQFLDRTWAGTGIAKTSNYIQQITAGLRYIAANGNFHDPIGAWAYHQSHGFYRNGGVIDKEGMYRLGEGGRREVVLPLENSTRLIDLLRRTGLDKTIAMAAGPNLYPDNGRATRRDSTGQGTPTIGNVIGEMHVHSNGLDPRTVATIAAAKTASQVRSAMAGFN